MMCPAVRRPREAQTYLHQFCQGAAGMAPAHTLIQAFLAIVRERRGDDLEAWRAEAIHCAPTPLQGLATFPRC